MTVKNVSFMYGKNNRVDDNVIRDNADNTLDCAIICTRLCSNTNDIDTWQCSFFVIYL